MKSSDTYNTQIQWTYGIKIPPGKQQYENI